MNVLSLFSGIGGLDLGLERAGMTVVGQVEIDPWCRKVLAKHWPEVPRHDDVRTCTEWWGDRAAPDLVAGGFPCQPVSVAGKQLAQADDRWLWPAFAKVIGALRPRFALMENVPGLLRRGIGDVLGDLAELGYDAEWDCIPAVFVGAPHVRNRVFIVAYPQREQLWQQPVTEHRRGRPAVARDDGTARPVADTEREGELQLHGVLPDQRRRPGHGGQEVPRHVADADCKPKIWPSEPRQERFAWPAEPDVGRVAHGVPRRVDRLRGLGNAVVPQVAEHIGRLIMAAAP